MGKKTKRNYKESHLRLAKNDSYLFSQAQNKIGCEASLLLINGIQNIKTDNSQKNQNQIPKVGLSQQSKKIYKNKCRVLSQDGKSRRKQRQKVESNNQNFQQSDNESSSSSQQYYLVNKIQQQQQFQQQQEKSEIVQLSPQKPSRSRFDNNLLKKPANILRKKLIDLDKKDLIYRIQHFKQVDDTKKIKKNSKSNKKKTASQSDSNEKKKQKSNKRGNRLCFVVYLFFLQLIIGVEQQLIIQFQRCQTEWDKQIQRNHINIYQLRLVASSSEVPGDVAMANISIKKAEQQIAIYQLAKKSLAHFMKGNQFQCVLQWFGFYNPKFKQWQYLKRYIRDYIMVTNTSGQIELPSDADLTKMQLDEVKTLFKKFRQNIQRDNSINTISTYNQSDQTHQRMNPIQDIHQNFQQFYDSITNDRTNDRRFDQNYILEQQ